MYSDLSEITNHFQINGEFIKGQPFGNGHIHQTFLIQTTAQHYILQKLNQHVFPNISRLMHNIELVLNHIQNKLSQHDKNHSCLMLIPCNNGKYFYHDKTKNYWRMFLYIADSQSFNIVDDAEKAFNGGKAFGNFLSILSDLPPNKLFETIPDFHNIENRLRIFFDIINKDLVNRVKLAGDEIKFVKNRLKDIQRIHQLGKAGKIRLRITHNDTKFNNILFDKNNQALCVIDLDTVMPGYIHYDFGDAIRTVANTGQEDEADLSKVTINLSLFTAFSEGFLSETKLLLNPVEIDLLAESARVMTFIIGLRFLTDFLNGDKYFKIHFENHNLQRARAQFKLVYSIEQHMNEMEKIINSITS